MLIDTPGMSFQPWLFSLHLQSLVVWCFIGIVHGKNAIAEEVNS